MVRGTFSPARAWRPAVGPASAQTLGRTIGDHWLLTRQATAMRLLALTLIATIPMVSLAGPFGLEAGVSLEGLTRQLKLKKEREYIYSTADVPRPHSDFERYTLVVTPSHGLCKISAWSKEIRSNSFGTAIQSKFDELESALSEKYGKVNRNDFLKSGSIWKEANYWMMALYKEERYLASYWSPAADAQPFPDNIKAIELEAIALSTTIGVVALRYEFKDASECLALLRKKRSDPL